MRELAFLPNIHGFEFIGVTNDGAEIDCFVHLSTDSGHIALASYTFERVFSKLVGWKPSETV